MAGRPWPCSALPGRAFPARRLRVIGVTGTDGKTTTTTFIHSILGAAGERAGMVSTVAAFIGGKTLDTGLHTTTPDAPDMQRYLAEMVADHCTYAVLETTSHGLAQKRADACDFDVAVVTNITHEHLDYHGTFENYREAKATLFRMLSTAARKRNLPKIAVINADDPSASFLLAIPADRHITYGLEHAADVTAEEIDLQPRRTSFMAVTPAGRFPVAINFPGRYNVANALAAISVAVGLGLPAEAIQRGLAARHRDNRAHAADRDGAELHGHRGLCPHAQRPGRGPAGGAAHDHGAGDVVFGCAGLRDRRSAV